MTEVMVYTNIDEVNDIYYGLKSHMIRTDKLWVKKGDIIRFRLVKNQKEIYHQINRKKYIVTLVETSRTAPIHRHNQIISFKELA
jgi:hypothetical protein